MTEFQQLPINYFDKHAPAALVPSTTREVAVSLRPPRPGPSPKSQWCRQPRYTARREMQTQHWRHGGQFRDVFIPIPPNCSHSRNTTHTCSVPWQNPESFCAPWDGPKYSQYKLRLTQGHLGCNCPLSKARNATLVLQ